MLDKNIDMLCLGDSFYSYLYGLSVLEKGKKVLLIDDEKHGYGELYTASFGLLEANFLQTWGEDWGILPLKNISNLLTQKPLIFIINNKQIKLGGNAFLNLVELMRKLPRYFSLNKKNDFHDSFVLGHFAETFNTEFDLYLKHLGRTLFRFKSEQHLSFKVLTEGCPKIILDIFDSFSSLFFATKGPYSVENWCFRGFIYLAHGYFQKKLSLTGSLFELFHTFLSLLSPHYLLDHKRLNLSLLSQFQSAGGLYKKSSIKEWVFEKGRPWSVELGTYEGVIRPENISFLIGHSYDPRILLQSKRQHYRSFKQEIEFSRKNLHSFNGARVICSRVDRMGTHCPLWYGDFSEKRAAIEVFYRHQLGLKNAFVAAEYIDLIQQDLLRWIPEGEEISFLKNSDGKEILMPGHSKILAKRRVEPPLLKGPKIVYRPSPTKTVKLKQVRYFGPFNEGPLGALSSLMHLKDSSLYM